MTPGQFLRLVWPTTGLYCIAHPFKPEGSAVTVYAHKVFQTISEAVTHCAEQQHSQDTFFAVLSLKADKIWDPEKVDYKTGTKGAWAVRKQANMLACKAAFWDIDVGSEESKYPTQKAALEALTAFLGETGLPMPMMVSSGGGIHVYWPFETEISAEEWKTLATHMRQLAEHLGLKIDPQRTTDISSVLRVLGSFNWKDRSNPREVVLLQETVPVSVDLFQRMISDALISNGLHPRQAPGIPAVPLAAAALLPVQKFNDFGPPPTLGEVAAACGQVSEIIRAQGDPTHTHYGQLDNTAWYKGLLGVISHVEDGDSWCRKLTDLHPRTNAQIDAKLNQLKGFGPARCETLQEFMPWKDTPCQTCKFRNDPSVPNPLAATRRHTVAPPPGSVSPTPPPSAPPSAPTAPSSSPSTGVAPSPPPPTAPAAPIALAQLVAPSMVVQGILIPNPPHPYERLKSGGISITKTDKDGNASSSVIYAHDLYPLKRLVNDEIGTEQQIWRVTLPRSGARDFAIDADALYDSRKFTASLSHNGIYPNKADLPALQDYMVAYISQLQKDLDADTQLSHLGWSDGYRQFVLPDKTLIEGAAPRISTLTEGARRATQHITKRGTLQRQVELMRFYDHPAYIPNQFAILCSLASVIFHATGNHGVVVNMSGDSGASKSTTLYTSASCFGDPALWPINGTNRGATANARAQRVITNANLPTPVDEITHLPVKEAIDLVMSITQPGQRLRLGTDGVERAGGDTDSYKAAIMISTANSSLHSLLSSDNAAGTAGSMRVFEMKFTAQTVHTKAEADEFLREIKQNFGHLGEIFVQFVVANRVAVENRVQAVMREIDAEGRIQSSERFWSAVVAVVLVAGEIAKALGLLTYDVDAIRQWALHQQIPYMRGVVREEYRDPLAVLTDYMAEKHGNILVIDKSTSIGANTSGQHVAGETAYGINSVNGALLGHYDMRAGVLYLLRQGFKDHCSRIGASSSRILEELEQPRILPDQSPRKIVTNRGKRVTLGAGTQLAKGQVWCIAIDMTHPEISGAIPVVVASGGVSTSPPAGNLKAVP